MCGPVADSVVGGWVLKLGGGVGGVSLFGLASGWLVSGLLEGVFVWCGCCAWRLRFLFKIWWVMVAVGCRLRVAWWVLWVAFSLCVGCCCGRVLGFGCRGGRWLDGGRGDRLVGLAVWGRGCVGMGWVDVVAGCWWAGMRVCWRRGLGGGGCVGRAGGVLAVAWVGGHGWMRKQSRVVWWLVGGVGVSVVP